MGMGNGKKRKLGVGAPVGPHAARKRKEAIRKGNGGLDRFGSDSSEEDQVENIELQESARIPVLDPVDSPLGDPDTPSSPPIAPLEAELESRENEIAETSGSDADDEKGELEADDDYREEVETEEEEAAGEELKGSAFSRAFGKIMERRIGSDAPGPILSERQQLVVQKLRQEEEQRGTKSVAKKERMEVREKNHVKPQAYTDPVERTLLKVATKGVVRLFNAVSKAQRVQAEVHGRASTVGSRSRAAKDAETKGKAAFLAELRGVASGAATEPGTSVQPAAFGHHRAGGPKEGAAGSGWSVLRQDFMLGLPKLKAWDKPQAEATVLDQTMALGGDSSSGDDA